MNATAALAFSLAGHAWARATSRAHLCKAPDCRSTFDLRAL